MRKKKIQIISAGSTVRSILWEALSSLLSSEIEEDFTIYTRAYISLLALETMLPTGNGFDLGMYMYFTSVQYVSWEKLVEDRLLGATFKIRTSYLFMDETTGKSIGWCTCTATTILNRALGNSYGIRVDWDEKEMEALNSITYPEFLPYTSVELRFIKAVELFLDTVITEEQVKMLNTEMKRYEKLFFRNLWHKTRERFVTSMTINGED